jgi:hypothetical protein
MPFLVDLPIECPTVLQQLRQVSGNSIVRRC